MGKILTRHFGELDVAEDQVIHFARGLVALHQAKDYVLLDNEDKDLPFHWLQSLDDPDLALVIMNPFLFRPDYDLDLPSETVEELEIEEPADVAVFSVVVVPEDVRRMTANLLAPLVINFKKRKGQQVVLNDRRYSVKHYILDEMKGQGGEVPGHACSDQKKR